MANNEKPSDIKSRFFTIIEGIGKGAFSEVFKAKRNGKDVAIKFEKRNAAIKYLPHEISVNIN